MILFNIITTFFGKERFLGLVIILIASLGTLAQTYTVVNVNDGGPGSFRDAYEQAALGNYDEIVFDIPDSLGNEISLNSGFGYSGDTILTNVTIDGMNNGKRIFLNKSNVNVGVFDIGSGSRLENLRTNAVDIHINGNDNIIQNCSFGSTVVRFYNGASHNLLTNDTIRHLGLANGSSTNFYTIIFDDNNSHEGNIISKCVIENGFFGNIWFYGGCDCDQTLNLRPNEIKNCEINDGGVSSINISSNCSPLIIGPDNQFSNHNIGVSVVECKDFVKISKNTFVNSNGQSIELVYSVGDGANNSKDSSNITSHQINQLTRTLTLNGISDAQDTVEVFLNNGIAENALAYLGSVYSEGGEWSIQLNLDDIEGYNPAYGGYFVTTATSPSGNTSELSLPYAVEGTSALCVVTNTADSGPGSLRAAIECANEKPGVDTVVFNIAGDGPYHITLESDILEIGGEGNGVVIDGATQQLGNREQLITVDGQQLFNINTIEESEVAHLAFISFNRHINVRNSNFDGVNFTAFLSGISSNTGAFVTFTDCSFDLGGSTDGMTVCCTLDTLVVNNCMFNCSSLEVLNAINFSSSSAGDVGFSLINNRVQGFGRFVNVHSPSRTFNGEITGNQILGNRNVFQTGGIYFDRIGGSFTVSGNDIQNAHFGIRVNTSTASINVLNNLIHTNNIGLSLNTGAQLTIEQNYVYANDSIEILVGQTNSACNILNNWIGLDTNEVLYTEGDYGILLGFNTQDLIIVGNHIVGKKDNIYFESINANNVKITRNMFSNSSNKAININSWGNGGKSKPQILNYSISDAFITLEGSSEAGDSIEVFLSDGIPQHATQYLGTVFTDTNGEWSYEISGIQAIDPLTGGYIVATATDDENNTSELSEVYTVEGTSALCVVTNTADSGPGSLRAAIECANEKPGVDTVVFNIAGDGPYEIFLESQLPDMGGDSNGVFLDGSTSNKQVVVDGSSQGVNTVWQVIQGGINDLLFRNFVNNFEVSGAVIENNRFENFGNGTLTLGIFNFVSNTYGTDRLAANEFVNSQGTAILISRADSVIIINNEIGDIATGEVGSESGIAMVYSNLNTAFIFELTDNTILVSSGKGIDFGSTYGTSIKGVILKNTVSGISSTGTIGLDFNFNGGEILVEENEIFDFEYGIYSEFNANDLHITSNVIHDNDLDGIYESQNDGTGANANRYENNYIYNNGRYGISVQGSTEGIIAQNVIGKDQNGETRSNGSGSILLNTVGSFSIQANNINDLVNNQVIVIEPSSHSNKISQNVFLGAEDKAILLEEGNNNKTSPLIESHIVDNGVITIAGTSVARDSIEVFLSDGTPQHATQYLGTVFTDTNGEWSYEIADLQAIDPLTGGYIVATATDDENNTSELSEVYQIKPSYTECIVTNTDLSGPGSLAEAITCANASGEHVHILFQIPGEGPHEFDWNTSIGGSIDQSLQIQNAKGVTIDGSSQSAWSVSGGDQSIRLNHKSFFIDEISSNSEIANLYLSSRSTGILNDASNFSLHDVELEYINIQSSQSGLMIRTNAKHCNITNVHVANPTRGPSSRALEINADSCTVRNFYSENVTIATLSYDVEISGNYNIIDSIHIESDYASNTHFFVDGSNNTIEDLTFEYVDVSLVGSLFDIIINGNNNVFNNATVYGSISFGTNNSQITNSTLGWPHDPNIADFIQVFGQGNTFDRNTISGDYLEVMPEADGNTFQHNKYVNILEKPLELNYGGTDPGNNNLQAAVIDEVYWSGGQLIAEGTAPALNGGDHRLEFVTYKDQDGLISIDTIVSIEEVGNPSSWMVSLVDVPENTDYLAVFVTDAMGNTSELSAPVRVHTGECIVTNTNDNGIGSLRDAIDCANNKPGLDSIKFAIPGNGPHEIVLESALPSVGSFDHSDLTIIDGSSQPSNVEQSIVINGMNVPATNSIIFYNTGLYHIKFINFNSNVGAGKSRISHCYFENFDSDALNLFGEFGILDSTEILNVNGDAVVLNADTLIIHDNYIGINKNGTEGQILFHGMQSFDRSEGIDSIMVFRNHIHNIDSADAGYAAILLYNQGISEYDSKIFENEFVKCNDGIRIWGRGNHKIESNLFIDLRGNAIGLRFCDQVAVFNNDLRDLMRYGCIANDMGALILNSNSFTNIKNNYSAIRLSSAITSGVFENNTFDTISGNGIDVFNENMKISQNTFFHVGNKAININVTGNNGIQAPQINAHVIVGNQLTLTGSAQAGHVIEVFLNDSIAQHAIAYIGVTTTDDNGTWSFSFTDTSLYVPENGAWFVATATDSLNNTSELSEPYKVASNSCVVSNTANAGEGSLRAALQCAIENPGFDHIIFEIPGPGPYQIIPASPYPAIVGDGVSIDAATQTIGTGDQSILVDGSLLVEATGFELENSSISNMRIANFDVGIRPTATSIANCEIWGTESAIRATDQPMDLIISNNTFYDCSASAIDLTNGLGTDSLLIQNNYIYSANKGIELNNLDQGFIESNFIGIDRDAAVFPISTDGIELLACENISVFGNSIVANTYGIDMLNDTNVVFANNYIGTNTSGDSLGISVLGVLISSTSAEIDSNTIAYAQTGIRVLNPLSQATIRNNELHSADRGISVELGATATINGNIILGNGSEGISLNDAAYSTMTGNRIGVDRNNSLSGTYINGIHLLRSRALVSNNILRTFSQTGILAEGAATYSDTLVVEGNEIGGFNFRGILLRDSLNFAQITNNYIGVTKAGDNIGGNNAGIIVADGAYNNLLFANEIANNTGSAIEVFTNANFNTLSQNLCYNNASEKEISLALSSAVPGNEGIDSPVIESFEHRRELLTLNGTALPGSTIEIFQNDDELAQNAVSFVTTITADTSGYWSAEIPSDFYDIGNSNNYIATTTDLKGNTSEFGNIFNICPSCVCTVENANDAGDNSFRDVIARVHVGECGVVEFNISDNSAPEVIELLSPIQDVVMPIQILGSTENGYQVNQDPAIVIQNGTGDTAIALRLFSYNNVVEAITFDGFDVAIELAGNNALIDQCVFLNNSKSALLLDGNENNVTNNSFNETRSGQDAYVDQSAVTLQVSGENNRITDNSFRHMQLGGIELLSGSGNSFLQNSFFNTGTLNVSETYSAINIQGNNDAIIAPLMSEYDESNGLVIHGEAGADESIQIFSGNGLKEQALDYILQTETDASGNWSAEIPSGFYISGQNNFYIATSTNSNGSTSPLSKPMVIGEEPVICPVTNVNDTGPGSLREAVTCANEAYLEFGLPAEIDFQLSLGAMHEISLSSSLNLINERGVLIDPVDQQVSLSGTSNMNALNIVGSNYEIAHLDFTSFDTAIAINGLRNVIDNVQIIEVGTGVHMSGNATSLGNVIRNSMIGSADVGIHTNGPLIHVQNNLIGSDSNGVAMPITGVAILVENGGWSDYRENVIGNVHTNNVAGIWTGKINGAGIAIVGESYKVNVTGNYLGFDALSDTVLLEGPAVYVTTNELGNYDVSGSGEDYATSIIDNFITHGTNGIQLENINLASVVGNEIFSADSNGIVLNNCLYGTISLNLIHNLFSDSGKGISLLNGANFDKHAPTVLRYTTFNSYFKFFGTGLEGDYIEFFRGTDKGQRAVEFLSSGTTNADGEWSINIPLDDINLDGWNYFVATAKDIDGNTSELSNNLNVFFKPCWVKNVMDEGDSTLRDAIRLANQKECNIVLFDISEHLVSDTQHLLRDTIDLLTPLPLVTVDSLIVDASFENGYDTEFGPEVLVRYEGLSPANGLEASGVNSFSMHGLGFIGFENAMEFSGLSNSEITHNTAKGYNSIGLFVNGNAATNYFENNLLGDTSLVYNGGQYGVYISQDGARFDSNQAVNNELAGFFVDGNDIWIRYSNASGNDTSNTTTNGRGGFVLNSGTGNVIKNNFATNNSIGYQVVGVSGNEISRNYSGSSGQPNYINNYYFEDAGNNVVRDNFSLNGIEAGMYIKDCESLDLTDNSFFNNEDEALLVENTVVQINGGEYVGNKSSGIVLSGGTSRSRIENTRFNSNEGDAIHLNTEADGVTIVGNAIGVEITDNIITNRDNHGIGMVIESSGNVIGTEDQPNYVAYNAGGGLLVKEGNGNSILYNLIFENDTNDVPSIKAIDLNGGQGNDNKQVPVILGSIIGDLSTTISGNAEPNDFIQVYRTNSYWPNAHSYLGSTTADINGLWTFEMNNDDFDSLNTTYVSATATDLINGNTSELSPTLPLGDCYVTVQDDNGDNLLPIQGSLREAINCVNAQDNNANIRFIVSGITQPVIQLKSDLPSILNPHEVIVDGANTDTLGHTLVNGGLITASGKIGLNIEVGAGLVTIRNFELSNFDTTLVISAPGARVETLNLFSDSIHAATGIAIRSANVSIINSSISGSELGVSIAEDVSLIAIRKTHFESDSCAIKALSTSAVNVDSNTFELLSGPAIFLTGESGIATITNNVINNVGLAGIAIRDVAAVNVLNNNIGDVFKVDSDILNAIEEAFGILLYENISNAVLSDNLIGSDLDNDIEGWSLALWPECDCPANDSSSNIQNVQITANTLSGAVNKGLLLSGNNISVQNNTILGDSGAISTRGLFDSQLIANHLVGYGLYGIDLELSNRVTMSQNLISGFSEQGRAINLNKSRVEVSNDAYPEPEDIISSIENLDCQSHFFVRGIAQPGDIIELFESDTIINATRLFIDSTIADTSGSWEIEIPQELYKLPEDGDYFFAATATDSLGRTSQLSEVLVVPNVSEEFLVTTTNADGQGSLMNAFRMLNCTQFFASIEFALPGTGPYTIEIDTLLPEIINPMGYEVLASSQAVNGDSALIGANVDIIVDGTNAQFRDWAVQVGEFAGEGYLESLTFSGFKNGLQNAAPNQLFENLTFTATDSAQYGIFFTSSADGSKIINSKVKNYSYGIDLESGISQTEISNNEISESKIGVALHNVASDNSIFGNAFANIDSVGCWLDGIQEGANAVSANTFGYDLDNVVAPIVGVAILINNSNSQLIETNSIANVLPNPGIPDFDAAIIITGDARNNSINDNRIAVDTSVNELIEGHGIVLRNGLDSSGSDASPRTNFITGNQVGNVTGNALRMEGATSTNVSANYFGVNENSKYFDINEDGVYIDNNLSAVLSNNKIAGFAEFGINLVESSQITLSRNAIYSNNSDKIGISLHLGESVESNEGISAPSLIRYEFVDSSEIIIHGTVETANALIEIFVGNNDASQSIEYIGLLLVPEVGNWSIPVSSEFFSFNGNNYFVATVSDENGNTSQFSNSLTVNELLCDLVDAGIKLINDDLIVCPGVETVASAGLNGMNYQWTSTIFSEPLTTKEITIAEPGAYNLLMTDDFGCAYEATLSLEHYDSAQAPNFIVASQALLGDTVAIIELAPEAPDSIYWDWGGATVWQADEPLWDDTDTTSDMEWQEYYYAIFPETGIYTFVQHSVLDLCETALAKEIEILDPVSNGGPIDYNSYDFNLSIDSLTIFPNPSDGVFSVHIVLNQEDALFAGIYRSSGILLHSFELMEADEYNIEISPEVVDLPNGEYVLRVVGGGGAARKSENFVIAK